MKLSVFKNNQFLGDYVLTAVSALEHKPLRFFIGRAEDCHVVLDDPRISRHHIEMVLFKGAWTVRNNSQFGFLLVNGHHIQSKEVSAGDVISIPPFLITLIEDSTVKASSKSISANTETVFKVQGDTTNEILESSVTQTQGEEEPSFTQDALESKTEGTRFDILGDNNENYIESALDSEQKEEFAFTPSQDSSSFTDSDSDSTKVTRGFATYRLLIAGEFAPYDRYEIAQKEVFIGRDPEKCQIILKDKEVSAIHAVLHLDRLSCTLEDLNSSNGTFLNGEKINKSDLSPQDVFKIGSTEFKVEVESDLLKTESDNLLQVPDEAYTPDYNTSSSSGMDVGEASPSKKSFLAGILKDPEKRKKVLMAGVGLMALWILLGEDPEKKPVVQAPKKENEHRLTKEPEKEKTVETKVQKRDYTKEELDFLESTYLLAKELFSQGKYQETIFELEKVFSLDADYKTARQIYDLSKQGLVQIEALEKERKAKIEQKIRQEKIMVLLEKARSAVKERQVLIAESLFNQILELDPENLDVSELRIDLEAWKREEERKALMKAEKEADRKRQLTALAPAKTKYLKEEWYQAINLLESFLKLSDLDEDLVKEATEMLSQSKNSLSGIVEPLLGKARSLREGQDLKGAYETYANILIHDPYHPEAITEMNDIRQLLDRKSKKVFREALIAESLNLLQDAKEKFQEVQQISPVDSSYYIKATEKLKEYGD
ncbi:MAG: FHA domain-containing protein [Bacteriovoracaceae bacterium]|nr:FHA domain-containing protein [Bacteriovoracaceae bacterium]